MFFRKKLLELKRLKEEHIKKGVDCLVQNDIKAASEHADWLKGANELLQELEGRRTTFIAIIIGVIITIIICIGFTSHISTSIFSLNVNTSCIDFRLKEDWNSRMDFVGKEIYVDRIKKFEIPNVDLRFTNVDLTEYSLELSGDLVQLPPIDIAKNGSIRLTSTKRSTTMSINGDSISSKILARNFSIYIEDNYGNVILDSIIKSDDKGPPVTIFFETFLSVDGSDPIRIELKDHESIKLSEFDISNISFETHDPQRNGTFLSHIQSGILKNLETGYTYQLEEGNFLHLNVISTRRSFISEDTIGGFNINLRVEADKISAGERDYEENQLPTLVEYMYHNDSIALAYTTIIFLWGLLWSYKKIQL